MRVEHEHNTSGTRARTRVRFEWGRGRETIRLVSLGIRSIHEMTERRFNHFICWIFVTFGQGQDLLYVSYDDYDSQADLLYFAVQSIHPSTSIHGIEQPPSRPSPTCVQQTWVMDRCGKLPAKTRHKKKIKIGIRPTETTEWRVGREFSEDSSLSLN